MHSGWFILAAVLFTGCIEAEANTFVYAPINGTANTDVDVNGDLLDADGGIDLPGDLDNEIAVLIEAVPAHFSADIVVKPGQKSVIMRSFIMRSDDKKVAVNTLTVAVYSNQPDGLDECRLSAWPAEKKCLSATMTEGLELTFQFTQACMVPDAVIIDVVCDISEDATKGQTFDIQFSPNGENNANIAGKKDIPVTMQALPGAEMPIVIVD